jgi:cytochrome-b5 reductase
MSISEKIRALIEEPKYTYVIVASSRIGSHIQKVTLQFDRNLLKGPFPIGSYVQFMIAGAIPRAYSVVESTKDTATFIMSFSGMGVGSRFFSKAPPGTTIDGFGPYDDFPYRRNTERYKIFLATGTGVAPFVRMVQVAIREKTPSALLLGSPQEEDLPYHNYFKKLDAENPGLFVYYPVLSRPPEGWNGGTGYITSYVPEFIQEAPKDKWDMYICGVPAMIYGAEQVVKKMKFPRNHVFIQKFG